MAYYFVLGRNEKSQLGHGDSKRRDEPTLVESLSHVKIVDAACGKNHTVFLTGLKLYPLLPLHISFVLSLLLLMFLLPTNMTLYILCILDKGIVYAVGDNKMGQLGLGHQSNCVPSPTKVKTQYLKWFIIVLKTF